jgi:hypothetical protein
MKLWTGLVLVGALSLSGCGTTAHRPDQHAGTEGDAFVLVRADATGETLVRVAPGPKLAEVTATWSNGARESARWLFDVAPGATYRVVAHEAGRGEVPVSLGLRDPPAPTTPAERFAKGMLQAGLEGFVLGAAPLILMAAPVWMPIYFATRRPAHPPAHDCCHVWLEDANGATVAGLPPPRPVAPIAASVAATAPPTADDELVDCVADGERQWTWRSRCE